MKSRCLAVSLFLLFLGLFTVAQAQDAMFVDSSGNVGVGTNSPTAPLHILRSDGSSQLRVEESSSNTAAALLYLRNNGFPLFRFQDTNQGLTWDFRLTSLGDGGFSATRVGSGQLEFRFENDGDLFLTGQVNSSSSRSAKEAISDVDTETILSKLDRLPINEWSYTQSEAERHLGPMAEDFYSVFGLGSDPRHISANDLAGVSLAASQALKSEVETLRAENQQLRARLAKIESAMEQLVTKRRQKSNK